LNARPSLAIWTTPSCARRALRAKASLETKTAKRLTGASTRALSLAGEAALSSRQSKSARDRCSKVVAVGIAASPMGIGRFARR